MNKELSEKITRAIVPVVIDWLIDDAEFGGWMVEREDEYGDVVERESLVEWLKLYKEIAINKQKNE